MEELELDDLTVSPEWTYYNATPHLDFLQRDGDAINMPIDQVLLLHDHLGRMLDSVPGARKDPPA